MSSRSLEAGCRFGRASKVTAFWGKALLSCASSLLSYAHPSSRQEGSCSLGQPQPPPHGSAALWAPFVLIRARRGLGPVGNTGLRCCGGEPPPSQGQGPLRPVAARPVPEQGRLLTGRGSGSQRRGQRPFPNFTCLPARPFLTQPSGTSSSWLLRLRGHSRPL